MKIKILIANIAFGLPGMDSPLRNISNHVRALGWTFLLIPIFKFFPPFSKLFKSPTRPHHLRFIKNHSTLEPILKVIQEQSPDILVLNELIFPIHQGPIEKKLRKLGFTSFAWGKSMRQREVVVSTLVASKLEAENLNLPPMTQWERIGSGGGLAGLKIKNINLSIIGLHLTSCYKDLWPIQLTEIARIAQQEKLAGNQVVIAGDHNQTKETLDSIKEFKNLGLQSSNPENLPTCPTCSTFGFIKPKAIDHVFIPLDWKVVETKLGEFGSDHRWMMTTIET